MRTRRMLADKHPLVLGMFLQGHSIQDIAENLRCTNAAVLSVIDKKYRKTPLPTPPTNFNITKTGPRIGRGESIAAIADEYDVWEFQVAALTPEGKAYNPGDPLPVTELDLSGFDIDDSIRAHWLGYLYVNARMNMRMDKIEFVVNDTASLLDLSIFLGHAKIDMRPIPGTDKWKATIRSPELCRKLLGLGMLPGNSNALRPPMIGEHLAGFFADGMITAAGTIHRVGPYYTEVKAPYALAAWLAERTGGAAHRGRDTYRVTWKD